MVYPWGVGEDHTSGHSRTNLGDLSSETGWVTTDVAAKAVRVSPRTIRRYIDQRKLQAKPQGEGVRREWLVSVDSLHALRASRTTEGDVPDVSPGVEPVDSIADVVREMAARLERRAEEAAELRVRLELTEQAQSTLDEERRRALDDLEDARRRLAEAERERDELRQELEVLKESSEEPSESPEPRSTTSTPTEPSGEAQEAAVDQRGWFRRFFGL